MHVREFDFDLPAELIAQAPPPNRADAGLLMVARATGDITHSTVSMLPELLRPDDLLVLNDTRVFPARLLGRREPSGGAIECLLIGRVESASVSRDMNGPDAQLWEALMHPGQKLK